MPSSDSHPDGQSKWPDNFAADMYYSIYNCDCPPGKKDPLPKYYSSEPESVTIQENITVDCRKSGRRRDRFERWLDKHNHVMELLRTVFALLTLSLQGIILGKLFNLL